MFAAGSRISLGFRVFRFRVRTEGLGVQSSLGFRALGFRFQGSGIEALECSRWGVKFAGAFGFVGVVVGFRADPP